MIVKLKPDKTIGKFFSVSKDKEYVAEVLSRKTGDWYKIKCDDGHIREFSEYHFISINEIRDKKLNDLGI
jgi:hypothetical protein